MCNPGCHAESVTAIPSLRRSILCLRRGLRLKDGPGSARASTVGVWLRLGFTLSPSARTGPSRLGPVGEARYPGGGRRREDEPPGKGGAFAPIPARRRAQGRRALGTVWRTRGCRPRPRGVWAVAPAVAAPHCLRGARQDLPCTGAGDPAPCDRRAISVQLAPATSGPSRSLADTPTRRSGHAERRSRTDSQADSPEGGPATPPPLGI